MIILDRYECEWNKWNFEMKNDLIYIQFQTFSRGFATTKQVLEPTSNFYVRLEDLEDDKAEQLWKKGEPDDEGYFTLENSKVPKVMTAIFCSGEPPGTGSRRAARYSLQVKGNITLRHILHCLTIAIELDF